MRVGDTVLYRGPEIEGEVPAIVTRVWTQDMVNLTVIADAANPFPRTSVQKLSGAPHQGDIGFRERDGDPR